MALSADARIPCRPLSVENKDLVSPKELLVDYKNGSIMICKEDGSFVDITQTIKEVIEANPEEITSSIKFEIEGQIYDLNTIIIQNSEDITANKKSINDINSALGYTKDSSGNVSFSLLSKVVTVDPSTGRTNKKIKAEDITESASKRFASDTEKTKWNAATKPAIIKATILAENDAGTVWSGSAAPYTQKVTVSGILESDTPVVDISLGDVYKEIQEQLDSYAYIYKILTYDGYIMVYATEKTKCNINIQMKVDR